MTLPTMRRLTFILPVVSLTVAGGIVTSEHSRHDRLKAELARTEREIARIEAAHPGPARDSHNHHDDHDD